MAGRKKDINDCRTERELFSCWIAAEITAEMVMEAGSV